MTKTKKINQEKLRKKEYDKNRREAMKKKPCGFGGI